MRPGNHAAGDGSFGRSAGVHAGKAAGLVAVAVIIGAVLLHHSGGPVNVSVVGGSSTTLKQSSVPTNSPTTLAIQTPTTQVVRAPSAVKVLVANGTGSGGLAAKYSGTLHSAGYDTLAPTDTKTPGVQTTSVYYAPSFQPEATALAQTLGVPLTAVQPMPAQLPVTSINGANILVVIGKDLGSAGGTTATTRGATTTTVKH